MQLQSDVSTWYFLLYVSVNFVDSASVSRAPVLCKSLGRLLHVDM